MCVSSRCRHKTSVIVQFNNPSQLTVHVGTGKYMSVPRTEGISTTDIVGRMLLMSRSHHDLGYSDTYTYSQSNSSRSDSRGLLNLRASSENREIKEEVNISPAGMLG